MVAPIVDERIPTSRRHGFEFPLIGHIIVMVLMDRHGPRLRRMVITALVVVRVLVLVNG
jgi:hypothetical protein